MSLATFPADIPYQDYIVLSGQTSPGLAVVRGCNCPRKWDILDGHGFTGASVIYNGEKLATFDVDFFAWEPEHFAAWDNFSRLTLGSPPVSKKLTVLYIEHPQVNDPPLSVYDVVVTNITQWEQSEEGGLWARTVSFLQYRAPKIIVVKPPGGVPGDPLKLATPVDPYQVEIARKQKVIDGLNK